MIERGDFFPRLLTFCGSLGRSMKRRILHGAQRILASGDPKAPQAQLRWFFPIYSTISSEAVSAGDILETKAPFSNNNMNHRGTMYAGITWMAAGVLGGLAYLVDLQDFGRAWAVVKSKQS